MSDRLIKAAKALVAAVDFDMNGMMIGKVYQGGNGGLISRETIQKSDELRRAIAAVEKHDD